MLVGTHWGRSDVPELGDEGGQTADGIMDVWALGSLVIDLILLDLQKTDLRQPLLRNLKIVRWTSQWLTIHLIPEPLISRTRIINNIAYGATNNFSMYFLAIIICDEFFKDLS